MIPPEVQAHSHAPKDLRVRVLCVIAAAKAWHDGAIDDDQAQTYLKDIDKGYAYTAISSHRRDTVRRIFDHFWRTGNVDLEPKSGRKPVVPDDVADLGASYMHHGRSREEVAVGDKTIVHLVGYDDVPDMIADHPDLAALLDQHHLTAKQLYAAMMRRDKNLVRHTLRFKYQFPDDIIESRKQTATECLELVDDVIAAARLVLDRMVFLDEGGFALSSLSKATHKVWGGKDDFKDCDVVHLPWVEGQKDCKVHWLVAVSSHPHFDAWNGIVFFEKTTGTTDIRRSINTMGQTAVEAYEYEVSYRRGANTMLQYSSVYCRLYRHNRHRSFCTCWNPTALNPAVNTTARHAAAVATAANTTSGLCRSFTCTRTSAALAQNALMLQRKSRIDTLPLQLLCQ